MDLQDEISLSKGVLVNVSGSLRSKWFTRDMIHSMKLGDQGKASGNVVKDKATDVVVKDKALAVVVKDKVPIVVKDKPTVVKDKASNNVVKDKAPGVVKDKALGVVKDKAPVVVKDRAPLVSQRTSLSRLIMWNSRRGPEFTWEREDQMQKKYPHLFTNSAPAAEVAS
ncbi:hypothetical protein Tco_0796819 [Tanacetum coccineum]